MRRRAARLMSEAGVLLMMISLVGCASGNAVRKSTAHFPDGRGFLVKKLDVDGQSRRYAIFIPRDYTPEKKYPTILFLHGLFEAGSDGVHHLSAGLAPVIARKPDEWPFIVVFPQSKGNWKSEFSQNLALACLDQVEKDYSVDRDRVIVSGMSVGGRGAWVLGSKHPERFAAVVPLSADASIDDYGGLVGLPIWCFHNSADPFVAPQGSRELCERIQHAGGEVTYTEFPEFGHDCWTRAYTETNLVNWMLQQHKSTVDSTATVAEP